MPNGPGDSVGAISARYRAFISYSHLDRPAAARLHHRLERYHIPRRLVGQSSAVGPVPRRIAPIFRDLEELPASQDLSLEVRNALRDSACLIVLCSPAAVASQWVATEIRLFRELHPDRPILAALIEGEPADAFPLPLRQSAIGELEPLAADFRPGGDGYRLALLKLVAGIVRVDLDQLVQRDAQARLRGVMAVTAVALIALLIMSVLTMIAWRAQQEAERERGQAEGLIEFMLTDLRTKLEGVGRLDALGAVNDRALAYYAEQDLDALPPESVERKARLFHAMGEDDIKRGRLDLALLKFREANRATGELLMRSPNDPKRIFAHAQSQFWIGYADYERGRLPTAKLAFEAYERLTHKLLRIEPRNPAYRQEAGYAAGNLCSINLAMPKADIPAALKSCKEALTHMQVAAEFLPPAKREEVDADLANRHVWLGDAYTAAGDLRHAEEAYGRQEAMIADLIAKDPENMELRDTWVTIQFTTAERDMKQGRKADALARLERARIVIDRMLKFDPSNQLWSGRRARILKDISNMRTGQ